MNLCNYFASNASGENVAAAKGGYNHSHEVERNIESYAFQRLFKSYDDFIHLQSVNESCLIPKRVKSLLLDIKSDELFTDVKFQKEQFDKYSRMLRKVIVSARIDFTHTNRLDFFFFL